jgi:hypothetical protein
LPPRLCCSEGEDQVWGTTLAWLKAGRAGLRQKQQPLQPEQAVLEQLKQHALETVRSR